MNIMSFQGTATREVTCVDSITKIPLHNDDACYLHNLARPDNRKECNGECSEAEEEKKGWRSGPWGDVSFKMN